MESLIFDAALRKRSLSVCTFCVSSGEEALQFLNKEAPFQSAGHVKLVMLDINMPGLNGFDTLSRIRGNPRLKNLPVILFSSSSAAKDIDRSYSLGANSFLSKPTSVNVYFDQLECLVRFWLHFARLPFNV